VLDPKRRQSGNQRLLHPFCLTICVRLQVASSLVCRIITPRGCGVVVDIGKYPWLQIERATTACQHDLCRAIVRALNRMEHNPSSGTVPNSFWLSREYLEPRSVCTSCAHSQWGTIHCLHKTLVVIWRLSFARVDS